MFIVRCPACGHDQKYQPQKGVLTKKSKRCVYCGHSFKVHANMMKSRIIRSL